MANKSVRIPTTAGGNDKYLTVKLENDVDFFEILSLKISQKDVYGSFNSDYGVIVGRVIANGGVGIPNAKLTVFIPISDEDKTRAEIIAVYPYNSPRDKDLNGIRYNLLPRVAVNNPFLIEGIYAPKVPVGTFPTKEEITTNETYLEVYEKYYKFTTVINESGDYMIFGVPIGIQTVHMSVDITDIGKYSMTPAAMITNLGYSPNLFTDNGTKVKSSTDLETIPNIELQEIAVEVRPFWGDVENFEIGITRQDFKIRAILVNTFTIFGAIFTDDEGSVWSDDADGSNPEVEDFFRINSAGGGGNNIAIRSKRISENIKETIFYYPSRIPDSIIDDPVLSLSEINIQSDILQLEKIQYSRYLERGQFVYIINCNRNKKITSENGDLIPVSDDSPIGIFTEFRGFITYDLSDNTELPINPSGEIGNRPIRAVRNRIKIPQSSPVFDEGLNNDDGNADDIQTEEWRRQNFKFEGGKIYSVAKYHTIHCITDSGNGEWDNLNRERGFNAGIIMTGVFDGFSDNPSYDFPSNGTSGGVAAFGAQWLNFTIHLGQQGYINSDQGDRRTNYYWTIVEHSSYYTNDNNQIIAGYVRNTKGFYRNDRHQSTFVEVPKEDILTIYNEIPNEKGFKDNDVPSPLIGLYKNGSVNGSGGRIGGIPSGSIDPRKYFYRGFDSADCIEFVIRLGIV
jgi:hypothetical protein